jgi:hypothetical protein
MFFIGVYVVRMNERINKMITELVEIISGMDSSSPPVVDAKQKTWDQKYEDELEQITKRMRQASGLLDLPSGRSYDAPN